MYSPSSKEMSVMVCLPNHPGQNDDVLINISQQSRLHCVPNEIRLGSSPIARAKPALATK